MAIFRPKPSQIFFFGLVPKSPIHIGEIYVKNPKPNISCLGPFNLVLYESSMQKDSNPDLSRWGTGYLMTLTREHGWKKIFIQKMSKACFIFFNDLPFKVLGTFYIPTYRFRSGFRHWFEEEFFVVEKSWWNRCLSWWEPASIPRQPGMPRSRGLVMWVVIVLVPVWKVVDRSHCEIRTVLKRFIDCKI